MELGQGWGEGERREEEGRREGAPSQATRDQISSTQSRPHHPWGPGNRRPFVGTRARPRVAGIGLTEDLVPLPGRLQTGQRRLWRVQRATGVSRVTMAASFQARGPPPPVHVRVELSQRCAGAGRVGGGR